MGGERIVLVAAALLLPAGAADARPARLRVLIVDGVNNHDWPATTAQVKAILEASGRFAVDVATSPPRGAPPAAWAAWRPDFRPYRAVLGNFNGGDHGPDVIQWPAPVRAAFEDYVRRGGGYVSFHAANNAFPGWRAYEEMVGLLWRPRTFGPGVTFDAAGAPVIVPAGQGHDPNHPARLDFAVEVLAPGHPVTRGLPARFTARSEQLTYGQHGLEPVVRGGALTFLTQAWCEAVGEREPMDWVRRWGRGRVFVTMQGHRWRNEPSPNFDAPAFRTLLLRGTEWAASGRVTLPVQR